VHDSHTLAYFVY